MIKIIHSVNVRRLGAAAGLDIEDSQRKGEKGGSRQGLTY
jgi:hypothetical protein